MTTQCYEMIRGSALRVTGLTKRGAVADPHLYGVSKAVARVQINEVTESGVRENIRNADRERRLRIVASDQTVRYTVDIDFLRVDPELLMLMADISPASREDYIPDGAFGEDPYGETHFGGGYVLTTIMGFDVNTKVNVRKAFALEIWSKIAGRGCPPQWGYTLFPFLKGGHISGFSFTKDGLVSFRLVGAQTRRMSSWGVGPYFLEEWCKLPEPVSGNTHWRTMLVSGSPPEQTDGVVEFIDEIDGGTASMTSPDELDGGTPFEAGPCVVDGGAA